MRKRFRPRALVMAVGLAALIVPIAATASPGKVLLRDDFKSGST
jgi:hypothetical protein